MTGLNEAQRTALERVVIQARATMEDDLVATLRGQYGISPDGTIEGEDRLADDEHLRTLRRTLVEILDYLRAGGADEAEAVERLVREATFTHVNRFIAIRVADALGVLPPSLRDGTRSDGFLQVLQLAPLLATYDDTGGYWTYLQLCADELARDVPALFDPRNPMLALRPSRATIDTIVAALADGKDHDIWSADDTFGWAYQFFNTGDERKAMRDASAAPRDSRELAVRNQFFTPRYVVDYLTQNTLGRRLLDANPASPLLQELPLLIDPPTEQGAPHDLADTRVLDPACGSGHFLLGCYEILEKAWALQGVEPRDAAPLIVPCLWGIDIDPRAVQVAQAAVIFRARKACGNDPLPPPNIATARALPDDESIWNAATAGLTIERRRLVDAMRDALRDAPTLGTLLKAEERLSKEIRTTVLGANPEDVNLFSAVGLADDAFGHAERDVIHALQQAADLAESSVADRLLAANANDSIRFLDAVRHRYDAVLMNPPFGEPIAETKPYLRSEYPWAPSRPDLFAIFVGRGLELCNAAGYLGAITSRAGMFLTTFEQWRNEIMLGRRLVTLADLGYGVMEQALVEAAAYVISPSLPDTDHAGVYIRLLKDTDRPGGLAAAIEADRDGHDDHRIFRVAAERFSVVPGSPVSYWMGDTIRALFAQHPALEGSAAEARVGLQTGDDFRFVRLGWEVDPRSIISNTSKTKLIGRWAMLAKGGEYAPFWSDLHLLVDWGQDGRDLRQYPGSVVRNPNYYFRLGLTWPRRTASGFGVRVLPPGAIFGDQGPTAVPSTNPMALLGYLNSRLVQSLLDAQVAAGEETSSGGAARSYQVGLVQQLPWPSSLDGDAELSEYTRQLVVLAAEDDLSDETTHRFFWRLPTCSKIEELTRETLEAADKRILSMLRIAHTVDERLLDLLAIDVAGRTYLDDEVGAHPMTYPKSRATEAAIAAHLTQPIDAMIDELVNTVGGSRAITTLGYVADRRVEVLSHAYNVNPATIVEIRQQHRLTPPGTAEELAARVVSWTVGAAFGRWDIRGPQAPEGFDPFSPLPVCPPSMLLGADGFPADNPPSGYPIMIPTDWVLLDEPGNPLDLTAALDVAAAASAPEGEELLTDAAAVLGRRSVRDYLSKQFFKDHVSRYSKSRRQAPLYWQLTIPSGAWSAWIYAPRLSREMLFAVVREADRRLAAGAERVRAWVLEQGASGNSRELAKRLDTERALIDQLTEFRNDISRIAGIGWEPDLDDGFVLNAAPLSRWFPRNTWKQATEALDEIRKGKKYDWATIHQYRGQL